MGDLSQTQINSLQLILDQQGVNQSMAQALLLWNNPDRGLNELILEKPVNGARMAATEQPKRPEIASLFKVFPNPAKDYFTLQYSSEMENLQKLSVIITDMQGRKLREVIFTEGQIDQMIDIKDLSAGVYSLTLYSGNTALEVKQLNIVK